MLDLHIVEILLWAFAINHVGFIKHANDAIYFCANCYTTLGMGKVDVEEHWKIISPIIGISGLFTFAWTTSALVDVVASNRRLIERLEDEREQEMHMRFALQKKEWADLRAERDIERAEEQKTGTPAVGASLIQKLEVWRRARKRMVELRREKVAEMEDLLRQERLKEREVEVKAASSSPEHKA
jgi:Ion channel